MDGCGSRWPRRDWDGEPAARVRGLQKQPVSNAACKPAPCPGNAHGRLPRKPQRNGTPAETAVSPNGRSLCVAQGHLVPFTLSGGVAEGVREVAFTFPGTAVAQMPGTTGAALDHGGGERKENGPGVAPRGGKSRSWVFTTSHGAGTLPGHRGKSWQGTSRVGTLGPDLGSP